MYLKDIIRGELFMKNKSLGLIAFLNAINTALGMLFPLVTYPYITRVLGAENLGKVNFSYSVVSYFALLSALGIYTYASREGAIVRENKEDFNQFSNEIFTINCISMCITYIIQSVAILSIDKLREYCLLIIIQSSSVLFTTIGVSWIYTIYEDYVYIIIRNVVFQIISLLLLFIFVRDEKDYVMYTLVTAISNGGSNIFNFFHARKYAVLRFTKLRNCVKHIKSILVIFASSIASTIYVNSDNIILGFLWGDTPVGLYAISVKIYSLLKNLVSAAIGVALPRVTLLFSQDREMDADKIINTMMHFLFFLVAPIVVGINVLCSEIIYIVGGKQFLKAKVSLHILMLAFVFSIFASLYSTLVLLPKKYERVIAISSTISAITNVLLNFFFITCWKQDGAAFTTAIAEIIVCCIYYFWSKKVTNIRFQWDEILKIFFSSIIMVPLSIVIKYKINNVGIRTISTIIFCGISYITSLLLLKSTTMIIAMKWIKNKFYEIVS